MSMTFYTGVLGYSLSENQTYSRVRLVVDASSVPTIALSMTTSQVNVTIGNGYTAGLAGVVGASNWRFTWMLDRVMGRGAQLLFAGTSSTWTGQLKVYGIELDGVPSESITDDR